MSILRRRRRLPGSERSSERSSSARAAAAPPRFVPARTGFASRPADSSPLAPRVRRAVPLFTPSALPRLEAPSPISSSDDPAGSGPGPSAGLPPLSFRRSENFGRSRRTPSARRERSRAASAEMVRGLAGASCVSPSFKSASSESESGAESETAPSSESECRRRRRRRCAGAARGRNRAGRRRPLARGAAAFGPRAAFGDKTASPRRRSRAASAAETTGDDDASLPTRGGGEAPTLRGRGRGCRRRASGGFAADRPVGLPRVRARGVGSRRRPRAVVVVFARYRARQERSRRGIRDARRRRDRDRGALSPALSVFLVLPAWSRSRRGRRLAARLVERPGAQAPVAPRRAGGGIGGFGGFVRVGRERAPAAISAIVLLVARGEASPSPHARPSEPSPASPSPGEAPPPPRVGTVARVRGAVPAAPRAARAALPLVRGRAPRGEEGARRLSPRGFERPTTRGRATGAAHDAARGREARGRASADAPTDAPSAAPPRARRAPREPARSSLPTNHDDDARGWKSSGSGHPRHSTARVCRDAVQARSGI